MGKPMDWTQELEDLWRSYAAEAEVMLGFHQPHLAELRELAPGLRWLQGTSTGIGPITHQLGWADEGIVVTSARGIHNVPIAEFHLMAMLAFTKDIFHLFQLKAERRFERYNTGQLRTKTLGIIGLGTNGTEIARLGRALGMRVLGTKRTTEGANAGLLGVDHLYPLRELASMLGECDFLSVTPPGTPETEGMLDNAMLSQLKPGAMVINTSRGTVVDEGALLRLLREGQIGGAALDVFSVEPLPPGNPLWEMDNVIISPHSASCAEFEDLCMTELFIDNLRRYLEGLPLRNIIDPALQY
jgi:phosphoglycerate dehydrogenase-like enzyme